MQARAPAGLPQALFGHQRTAQLLCLHYLHGVPLGRRCAQLGLRLGSVIALLHRLAAMCQPVLPTLIAEYRQAPVRHADATAWRTDGRSGYAWLFCTPRVRLFLFRNTRSATVPQEVLGTQPLSGVLVVDRYSGYNRAPCALQYCYAHLLREVEDLGKEFPEDPEVGAFTGPLIPLLREAMRLPTYPLADGQYYAAAALRCTSRAWRPWKPRPAIWAFGRSRTSSGSTRPGSTTGSWIARSPPTTTAASVNCAPRSSPAR